MLEPATPIVIAHRGASASAPEHTIASYDRAVAEGADYIELDIQRTVDGALVVIHDATLDRTARGGPANCAGRVAEKTLAQLRSCDAGSWFNTANPEMAKTEFTGLRILTLGEVITRYGASSRLYIETKDPESYPGIEADLVATLKDAGIKAETSRLPRVFIQSFSDAGLRRVHSLDPSLPLIQLIGAMPAADVVARLSDITTYAVGIGLLKEDVTAAVIAAAHADCLVVHPYTVDDESEMQSLLALGVNGIFTDRPDLLRQVIDRSTTRTVGETGCTAVAR